MRILIILLALSTSLFSQGPIQFQGGGPSTETPLTVTGPDTVLLQIDSFYGFNYQPTSPDFYDEDTGRIQYENFGDAFSVRLGGNFKVPDDVPFAKFGFFTDLGNGITYTRLGQEYNVGYHQGWEQLNEQNLVAAGDSIFTGTAGAIYLIVEMGAVEVANLNLLIQKTNGNSTVTAPGDGYITSVIWAEENGGIGTNTLGEYSFGNGATGGVNFGLPIWENMTAVGMVFNAETAGTNATVTATINGTNLASGITSTSNTAVSYFPAGIPISQGDLLNFRTVSVLGTFSDVRVGLIVEQKVTFR